jgi:hypothetical protein
MDPYAPTKEDRFSFGLWTVSNPGADPFGDAVCLSEDAIGTRDAPVRPEVGQKRGLLDTDGFGPGFLARHAIYAQTDCHCVQTVKAFVVLLQVLHL